LEGKGGPFEREEGREESSRSEFGKNGVFNRLGLVGRTPGKTGGGDEVRGEKQGW